MDRIEALLNILLPISFFVLLIYGLITSSGSCKYDKEKCKDCVYYEDCKREQINLKGRCDNEHK